MARSKTVEAPPAVTLADLAAVDGALIRIAAAESDTARLAAEMEDRLREVRQEYAPRIQSLDALAVEFRDCVREFCDGHPELFKTPRHRDLAHGRIGYRRVELIRLLKKIESVVAALRERRLLDAIVTTEKPNKDVLATYQDETLRAVGAKRETKDQFYIDLRAEPAPAAPAAPAPAEA
jgi:phage host-nuclease inhibitor protein Gam